MSVIDYRILELDGVTSTDQLCSASWITDNNGFAVQHLQYLPFGQPFVNQHPSGYQERYTFTGKERDEETGFGYFGARYMDHDLMTMWLSVDPMADKYPNISPYAYCAWNPMRLVDLDGNEAVENDDWYINSKGEIRWFNSTDETYTFGGEEYTKYGQTARMTNGDGEFVYGDQYGHTHSTMPLREVTFTETLTDFERTMYNPLVQRIHQSPAVFWGAVLDIGLEVGAQTLSYCGLGVQTIGFYCMIVPGGQILGAEMFAIGQGVASFGAAFDAINCIRRDDWTGVALDAASVVFPRGVSKLYGSGVRSGFLSSTPEDVGLFNSFISTRTGIILETINLERK